MKKVFFIILGLILLSAFLVFVFPFKIERVCFGDVCPENGGIFILYRTEYSKEKCIERGGYPIEGLGWSVVYAGCSPMKNKLFN